MQKRLHVSLRVLVKENAAILRQIIKQPDGFFIGKKQRQHVFRAGGRLAVADFFQNFGAAALVAEPLGEGALELLDAFGGEVKLAGGQGLERFHPAFGALGFGVEYSYFLHFVVKQDDAERLGFSGGEDVGLSAADGEFTGGADLVDSGVSAQRKSGGEGGEVDFSAESDLEDAGGDEMRGSERSERGGGGGDGDSGLFVQQIGKRAGAGADGFGGRREGVVGKGFPVGQVADGKVGRKKRNFLGEVGGGKRVAREEERRAALAANKSGDCKGLAGAAKSDNPPRLFRRDGK